MLLPVFEVLSTAFDRCASVSARTIARPLACSSWRMAVPAYLPDVATLGSDPQKAGVITT